MLETIPWWGYVVGGGMAIGLLIAGRGFALAGVELVKAGQNKGGNGSTSTALVGVLTDLSTNIRANTTEIKTQTNVLQKMDRKLSKLNSIEKTGKETAKSMSLVMTRQNRMYAKLEKR